MRFYACARAYVSVYLSVQKNPASICLVLSLFSFVQFDLFFAFVGSFSYVFQTISEERLFGIVNHMRFSRPSRKLLTKMEV